MTYFLLMTFLSVVFCGNFIYFLSIAGVLIANETSRIHRETVCWAIGASSFCPTEP